MLLFTVIFDFYVMLRSIIDEISHDYLEYMWLCTCEIIFYLAEVFLRHVIEKIFTGITFLGHTVYAVNCIVRQ